MEDSWAVAMSARGNPSGRFSIPDLFSGPTTCVILTLHYFGNKTMWRRILHILINLCKLSDCRVRTSLE